MHKYFKNSAQILNIMTSMLFLNFFSTKYVFAAQREEITLLEFPTELGKKVIIKDDIKLIDLSPRKGNPEREGRADSLEEFIKIYNTSLLNILNITRMTEKELQDAIEECGWGNIEEYVIRLNLKNKEYCLG